MNKVRIEVTLEQAQDMMFGMDSIGYCLACGAERDDCEPDARNYECYDCGANEVYGFEELVMMGMVDIL